MSITAEHLAKLQAGRAKKAAEQRIADIEAVAAYREWSQTEAKLYVIRETVADIHGRGSGEYELAKLSWIGHWRKRPIPPADSSPAWQS